MEDFSLSLCQLTSIDLQYNSLTVLNADCFKSLANLEYLTLNDNQHFLSGLSVLDMYRTNLGALDQDLFVSQSDSLQYFNLGDTVLFHK